MRRYPQAALLACSIASCALAGTGGREVEITMELTSEPPRTVVTFGDDPFTVELLEARLVVGAVYLFPPPPDEVSLLDLIRPSRAFAHAGDDNEAGSNAIAEHLDQVVIDALRGESIPLGVTSAEAARVDRGSVLLDHPRGALAQEGTAGPTRGHLAWVRARATRGEVVIEVEAGLDIPNTPLSRRVDRILPTGARAIDAGSHVVFGVRADEWLREVLFEELLPADHDPLSGPVRVEVSWPSQLHNAWQAALTRPQAFSLRVEDGS